MLGGSGIARGIMRTTRAQHLHSRLYLFGLPMIGFPSLRGMISDKFGCGTREETSSGRLVRKVTTAVQLAVSGDPQTLHVELRRYQGVRA